MTIKLKEAAGLITALQGGVVPNVGIQHITVGRDDESRAIITSLQNVGLGNSDVKFWIGDFGSGKSFILQLIQALATKMHFVVATADLDVDARLYSNDGKAVLVYQKLLNNLHTQTNQSSDALPFIIEEWIEKLMMTASTEHQLTLDELGRPENHEIVIHQIITSLGKLSSIGSFEFGQVIAKYYQGYIQDNIDLKRAALRWLRAQYTTRIEARNDLGVRDIINDENYYDMLKNLAQFFVQTGYAGFVINLDEMVNLYNIVQTQTRDKNYEKILSIYNDCLQGGASHLFINFAGTPKFLEDERRGLFSYKALKTRLRPSELIDDHFRDMAQPVITIPILGHNEIFVLLRKLHEVFESYHGTSLSITDDQIQRFMAIYLNRPGASEHLTPREVSRGFLQLLSIVHQNPQTSIEDQLNRLGHADQHTAPSEVEIL